MPFDKTFFLATAVCVVVMSGWNSNALAQAVFADSGLTDDLEKLADEQLRALFPNGPEASINCTRGEPEPWFRPDQTTIRKSFFESLSAHEAVETVLLKNGANLIIVNWGCESYVNTLRIVSAETAQSPDDTAYWFMKAAAWLDELAILQPQAFVALKASSQALRHAVETQQPLQYGAEVIVRPGEIAEKIVILGVGALPDGQGSFIELTLKIGPL